MPIDANIPLGIRPVQLDNPQDVQIKGLQLRDLNRRSQQADQDERDQQTIRDLYRTSMAADGSVDNKKFLQGVAQAGLGDRIPALQKANLDARKAGVDADTSELALHKKRLDMLNGGLASLLANPNVTHDDVIAQIHTFVNQGLITPDQGAEAARNTPGRPEQLRPFLVQRAVEAADASKQLEAVLPKYDEQDRGDVINQGTIDPLTGTRTPGVNVRKGVTPNLAATTADKSFTQDEGNLFGALAERGVALPAGLRSREQMKATARALIDRNPDLTVEQIADKVASGQITFGANKGATAAAEKDFGTGKSGQMLRSIGTANKHLNMLNDMVDALGNGNLQLANKLGNAWAKQTGSAAPNSFDAVKQIVGQEVVKAIVAGGGGVQEREEAGNVITNAGSPKQLKDVIARYRQIMDAQRESLIQQHRSLGLPDSQLANYEEGADGRTAAPSVDVPPDIAALLKKHGSK